MGALLWWLAGPVPAMSRRRRPRRRRRHREHGERPKQSGGPRRGGNSQRSGREEAGLSGRGNSCPAEVGGGACGVQRSQRHAGAGLPGPTRKRARHPLEAHTCGQRALNPRPTLKAAQGGELGRHAAVTTLGPWSMRVGAPLSKPERRSDGANQRDRGISSVASSTHLAERLSARYRLDQETLARVTGRGETRRFQPPAGRQAKREIRAIANLLDCHLCQLG
jgi:hypothetical protein